MAITNLPNPLNSQAGTTKTGVKIDANSPEVQAYMKQFPAVNLDAAIGSVLNQMNAKVAGQTPMPTPASAGTPGFGGGLASGQKAPYPYPPITSPAGPTGLGGATGGAGGLGGGDVTNPQYGSQSAFMSAFSTIMNKATKNQSLQDQKNKLIAQLYDHPLTPDELRTLSPAQQQAIQAGDKNMIEYQITSLNDIIKGRADEVKTSLDYMMEGYQMDQATAKAAQAEADKKRDDARAVIMDVVNKYSPEALAAAGITQDDIQHILDTGEVTAEFALRLSKVQTLAAAKAGTDYQSAAGKEYSDYVANETARGNKNIMSFNDYMNMDANRKARINAAGTGEKPLTEKDFYADADKMLDDLANGKKTWGEAFNYIKAKYGAPDGTIDKLLDKEKWYQTGAFETQKAARSGS